jgi:heat shock protein HslJ
MRLLVIAAGSALLGACMHGHHDMGAYRPDGRDPSPPHDAGDAPHDHALHGEWIAATRALQPPTITFEAGRASGFAGCNRWFAEATHDGASLRFGAAGATRMACEPPMMQIESDFLSMIERTRAYRRDGDTLTLLDEDGAEIGTFLRAR